MSGLNHAAHAVAKRILLAEDDHTARKMLAGVVHKWGYDPIAVADGDAAWQCLQDKTAPRLLLLDWMMPGIDGLELCRRIRLRKTSNPAYIILLTARDSTEDIVRGLNAGANDYIVKPFQPAELEARLKVGGRLLVLQEELNEARERLAYQALHDPLTGCLNRRAIMAELDREIARARRDGKLLYAAICDLDHFKSINDHHGHQAGDTILNEFVRRLTANLRTYDRIGRYGGEEFLLLTPVMGENDPPTLFERLRLETAAQPFQFRDFEIAVTVSIGVASLRHEDNVDLFLARADEALYQAKNAGRNQVAFRDGA